MSDCAAGDRNLGTVRLPEGGGLPPSLGADAGDLHVDAAQRLSSGMGQRGPDVDNTEASIAATPTPRIEPWPPRAGHVGEATGPPARRVDGRGDGESQCFTLAAPEPADDRASSP